MKKEKADSLFNPRPNKVTVEFWQERISGELEKEKAPESGAKFDVNRDRYFDYSEVRGI